MSRQRDDSAAASARRPAVRHRPRPRAVPHAPGGRPVAECDPPHARRPAARPVPAWLDVAGGWSWRILLTLAVVAIVFWAVAQVQLVFVALFLGLVMTAVLRPVVDLYARLVPRGVAVALGMLTALVGLAAIVVYVVTSVAGQWSSLTDQFSDGVEQIFDFLKDGPLPFSVTYDDFSAWLDDVVVWIKEHASVIAGEAASRVGAVVEVLTAVALAVFCSIFFLARGDSMWRWFVGQLPARARRAWDDVAGAGWQTFSGYTRGTVIIALSDGILAGIFLAIAGVPLAAPLAVLVFVGAFIPLIGAPAAMVIAMVVALAANGIVNAAVVGIGIALIGQFEGHVLQPIVMGHQVSLHPVVVAVVVACGTLVAGIVGAVVAVPLVAVAWTVFSHLRTTGQRG